MYLFLLILLAIIYIVLATVRFKLHPLLSLFTAALGVGLIAGIGTNETLEIIMRGFGETLSSIGFVIVFGAIIGLLLEKTNGTKTIVNYMLKWFGIKRSAFAMNLTGFIVSIPVFCDSAFVILSSLNKTLSKRTGIPLTVFAVSLATGLYAAHVFIPPTPGPLAAAALLDADLGSVLLYGLMVAIPVSLIGYLWAKGVGSKSKMIKETNSSQESESFGQLSMRSLSVFLPILTPIILIALKSIAKYPTNPFGQGQFYRILDFLGHPIIALLLGVVIAFIYGLSHRERQFFNWTAEALKEAGVIILITGAGGAFGAVLKALDLAEVLNFETSNSSVGLLIAFGFAAILKTAQGSSTVAIVTASAFMAPLLSSIGLDSEMGKTFTVLAIGAGAMTVSHLNDSYFWVVSQFSHMDVKTALKHYTTGTFIQGIFAILLVLLLFTFLN
ncbi:MAG: GntP family permease [Bacteroidia bacterium]|nr:GntP family permease [Bacteroidia bacterium]MBT8287289.1 GntP family permease [Bacteroidia bacterium]